MGVTMKRFNDEAMKRCNDETMECDYSNFVDSVWVYFKALLKKRL
jgi:hypothetical protein